MAAVVGNVSRNPMGGGAVAWCCYLEFKAVLGQEFDFGGDQGTGSSYLHACHWGCCICLFWFVLFDTVSKLPMWLRMTLNF